MKGDELNILLTRLYWKQLAVKRDIICCACSNDSLFLKQQRKLTSFFGNQYLVL